MADRLYTIRGFARALGLPSSTMHRWVQQGRVPTVDMCGTRRISLRRVLVQEPGMYEHLASNEADGVPGVPHDSDL